MMRIAWLALLLTLPACMSTPAVEPGVKIEIQKVDVPVYVTRTPPAEVLDCIEAITAPTPAPKLMNVAGGVLVPTGQVPVLLERIHSDAEARRQAATCDAAWRAWATSP
jgi:hypothetical protein